MDDQDKSSRSYIGAKRSPEPDVRAGFELPPDERATALARIAVVGIAGDPVVSRFRDAALPGRLLDPAEIDDWVERMVKSDADVGHGDIALYLPCGGSWPNEPQAIRRPRRGGVFSELRDAAWVAAWWIGRDYDEETPYEQARMVGLVLCGTIEFPRARMTVNPNRAYSELGTMTITVGTRVSQKELLALYNRGRRALGRRGRDIREPWRADLAVFTEEVKPGRTWRKTMEIWNEGHPEKAYTSVRRFSADCRDSYRRITGDDLKLHHNLDHTRGNPRGD